MSLGPLAAGRGGHGVERVAHRAVADRVHVHLEPVAVQLGDGGREHVRRDELEAARCRCCPPQPSQVGLEHGAGAVLQHAVEHDLHGVAWKQPAGPGGLLALGEQLLDLLQAAPALPPQRRRPPGR